MYDALQYYAGLWDLLTAFPTLHRRDGPDIFLAPSEKIQRQTHQHGSEKDDDAPVERARAHGGDGGPQGPEVDEGGVADADDVDGDAPPAEVPARLGHEVG